MFYTLYLLSSLAVGALATARTSAPSGAIVVAKSGGDFTTIQAAVDASSSGNVIFIQAGTYEEQVLIPDTVGSLTIYGYTEDDQDYSKNTVTLTNSLGADEAGNNDSSGTLRAKNDGLKVYNVNVANSRGEGVQAIALSAYGSEQGYYGCQFTGYQDTVLSNEGYHYFHGCYVEGATDFIFGQEAVAWFEACTIGVSGSGYITASGRDSEDNPSWYVINDSVVTALSGVGDSETYLGRPWRTYARVVFQNSELGAVVNEAGWSVWGDNPTDNVYYGEYGNTGEGASGTRASFAQELRSAVVIGDILGETSWLDEEYIGGTDGSATSGASETPAATTPASQSESTVVSEPESMVESESAEPQESTIVSSIVPSTPVSEPQQSAILTTPDVAPIQTPSSTNILFATSDAVATPTTSASRRRCGVKTSDDVDATTLQTFVRSSIVPAASLVEDEATTPTSASASATSTSSNDCSGTPDGFASLNGGTTGGSGGQVVVVSTQEDLEKYAAADGKYVIKVSGTITITPKGTEVEVTSDKTIVGIGADAEIYAGGFNLQNQRNVIFRNIKIGTWDFN